MLQYAVYSISNTTYSSHILFILYIYTISRFSSNILRNFISSSLSEHHSSSSSPCSPTNAATATYCVNADLRLNLSPYCDVRVTSPLVQNIKSYMENIWIGTIQILSLFAARIGSI